MKTLCIAVIIVLLLTALSLSALAQQPRTIITTDPELDDANSLIRLLLYSNELRIEGLIYSSSRFHWRGDGKGTPYFHAGREYTTPQTSWRWAQGERFIDIAVDAYARVYANLRVHDPKYPKPELLRSKIREGNVNFEGEMTEDTPGSRLIEQVLLDRDSGPVYLQAWAGTSTIARALKAIEEKYGGTTSWDRLRQRVSRKAVLIKSGSQDDTYSNYISRTWPALETRDPGVRTWGYAARAVMVPPYMKYLSATWTEENVSARGPLGALYRVWGDGKQMVKDDIWDHFGFTGMTAEQLRAMGYRVWTPPQEKGSWISEGDSPTFLNLLGNGLRSFEHPGFGGWGGRQVRNPDLAAEFLANKAQDRAADGSAPADYAAARWFEAAQLNFAARLKWSVSPAFKQANHVPSLRLLLPANMNVRPGQQIVLSARATDPDHDSLDFHWWYYREAGTYAGDISIQQPDALAASASIPQDAVPGNTMHMILEVRDRGTPALTHYQRVILTVR